MLENRDGETCDVNAVTDDAGTTRREFLARVAAAAPAIVAGSAVVGPWMSARGTAATTSTAAATSAAPAASPAAAVAEIRTLLASKAPFALAPLPYAEAALEPHIDATTMGIHHGKHHKAYVDNLNKAIAATPELKDKTLGELLGDLAAVPEKVRNAVRNNGGGHLNHAMFWQSMAAPASGAVRQPSGALAEAITRDFGSFAEFQKAFEAAGLARFGSGWAWLVAKKSGDATKLSIVSTPNQDAPIMEKTGGTALLGNDVWEHAYYLKYQNRRADYLKAWWNVVNWDVVAARFES